MKTAMQQLIEDLESIKDNTEQSSKIIIQSFIDKAKLYLTIEEEQLDNAYDKGKEDGMFAERQIHVN